MTIGKPLANLSLNELIAAARAGELATTTLSLVRPGAPPAPGQGHAFAQDAPNGSPLAVELIQARDLAELASRLSRSKSDFKQSTGRALLKAISGQLWAPDGHRDNTAYQIAAECIQAFPNLDPASVVQCFSAAISNAQAHGSDITPQKWAAMLVRVQNERQLRLNMVGQVAPLLSATGRALEAQAKLTTAQTPPPATAAFPAPVLPSGATPEQYAAAQGHPIDTLATVWRTLVILADGTYYLRHPSETHYRWHVKGQQALRVELAAQFGVNNQTVITHDAKGKPLPVDELLVVYGSNAHKIVYDFSSERTTWDAESSTLRIGLPADLPEPRPDLAVHDWLEAIAGSEAAAKDLYEWIAASRRNYINHPAAALVLIGPPDAGKGVLVRCVAETWGCFPVKLDNTIERFNGSLRKSPVWHGDEKVNLSNDVFRLLVQERERLIELKGAEKAELHGCGRLAITVNAPEDVQIGAAAGAEAFKAIVDRLAVFDCRSRGDEIQKAMAPLMLPNSDMDRSRIVQHLRWVQETYAPQPQRFLGARADRSEAEGLVLQGSVDADSAGALEAIAEYLRSPAFWESQYHASAHKFPDGYRYPLVTQGSQLYAHPQELLVKLGVAGRQPQATQVLRALKGLRADNGPGTELSFEGRGGCKARYWRLDVQKLLRAVGAELDADVQATLIVDTRTRKTQPAAAAPPTPGAI